MAMVGPPRDERTRSAATPSAFRKLTAASSGTSIADGDAVVVELAKHRAGRLLADLGLAPTVPVPCSGCCRCYGIPVGSGCGS
jgi:hypothetical protein